MMQIETYSDKYAEDVTGIVQNFYLESVGEYDGLFEKEAVTETIDRLKKDHADNAFLLIVDGKCEGLLAGIEIYSLYNKKRVFQELIWYVNAGFRKYGVALFEQVRQTLKDRGFETIIMAVMENSKTDKIKRLYESLGLKAFESHYMGAIA